MVTKKIAVYCINNKEQINEPLLLNYSLNFAEFFVSDAVARFEKADVVDSHDLALKMLLESNADYGIIFELGNVFEYHNKFFSEVKRFISEHDFFCAGHILDRKESYYELHSQCFIINVNEYRKCDYPPYISDNSVEHSLEMVERSQENYHDDYTPLWIKNANKGKRHFGNIAPGALIIEAGIKNELLIKTFDQELRDSKLFLYPRQNNKDKLPELNSLILREQSTFYAINTEGSSPIYEKELKPLSRLHHPASGMNAFLILKNLDYCRGETYEDKKARINFYDSSLTALSIMSALVKDWDGRDYPGYVSRFRYLLKNKQKVNSFWDYFLEKFGGEDAWVDWFNELRWGADLYFHNVDAFSSSFMNAKWLGAKGMGDSLLNLSNIYNYWASSGTYSYEERLFMLNRLLSHLRDNEPELWIVLSFPHRYNNDCDIPYTDQMIFKAEDFKPIEKWESPFR